MRRPRLADLALAGAVLFLGAAMVYRAKASESRPVPPPPRAILAPGEVVPAFWRDLGWSEAPAGPTLVIFYTVECPWCRISVKRWNRLRETFLAAPGAQAVAVTLSDSAASLEYPAQTGLAYPVRVPVDVPRLEERWKIAAVPYTVVLEPDGRVRGAWRGVVDSVRYETIARVAARPAPPAAGR